MQSAVICAVCHVVHNNMNDDEDIVQSDVICAVCHVVCYSKMSMNTNQRASWSTLSRRRDKPWRVSAQVSDQKAPTAGSRVFSLRDISSLSFVFIKCSTEKFDSINAIKVMCCSCFLSYVVRVNIGLLIELLVVQ